MNIGKAIKYFRNMRKLTVTELSDMCGLSQPAISQIENGKRDPSQESIESIAKALNVSVNELVKKAESYHDEHPKLDVYEFKRRKERFMRTTDLSIFLTDTIAIGININIVDFLHDSHRRRGLPSPIESLIGDTLYKIIDENRGEIAQRISKELNDLELSVEELLRNIDK